MITMSVKDTQVKNVIESDDENEQGASAKSSGTRRCSLAVPEPARGVFLDDSVDNLSMEVHLGGDSSCHPSEISSVSYQNLLDEGEPSDSIISRRDSEDSLDSYPPDFPESELPPDDLETFEARDLPLSEHFPMGVGLRAGSREKSRTDKSSFISSNSSNISHSNVRLKSHSPSSSVEGYQKNDTGEHQTDDTTVKRNSLEIRNNIPCVGQVKDYDKELNIDVIRIPSYKSAMISLKQSPGLARRVSIEFQDDKGNGEEDISSKRPDIAKQESNKARSKKISGRNKEYIMETPRNVNVENEYDYVKYARVQQGNSYVGMRLAYSSSSDSLNTKQGAYSEETSRESSPEKSIQLHKLPDVDCPEKMIEENLTEIPLHNSDSSEDKKAFTLSPENTECDSVEVESVTSEGESSTPGFPALEDGLSSSQASDVEEGALALASDYSPSKTLKNKQKMAIDNEAVKKDEICRPQEINAEAIMTDLKMKREALDLAIADIKSAIQKSKSVSLEGSYACNTEGDGTQPVWVKRVNKETADHIQRRQEEMRKVQEEIQSKQHEFTPSQEISIDKDVQELCDQEKLDTPASSQLLPDNSCVSEDDVEILQQNQPVSTEVPAEFYETDSQKHHSSNVTYSQKNQSPHVKDGIRHQLSYVTDSRSPQSSHVTYSQSHQSLIDVLGVSPNVNISTVFEEQSLARTELSEQAIEASCDTMALSLAESSRPDVLFLKECSLPAGLRSFASQEIGLLGELKATHSSGSHLFDASSFACLASSGNVESTPGSDNQEHNNKGDGNTNESVLRVQALAVNNMHSRNETPVIFPFKNACLSLVRNHSEEQESGVQAEDISWSGVERHDGTDSSGEGTDEDNSDLEAVDGITQMTGSLNEFSYGVIIKPRLENIHQKSWKQEQEADTQGRSPPAVGWASRGYDSDDECGGIRYTRRNRGKKYAALQKDDSLESGQTPSSASRGEVAKANGFLTRDKHSSVSGSNGSLSNHIHLQQAQSGEDCGHGLEGPLSSDENSDIHASLNLYSRPIHPDSDTDEETDRLLQKQYQERDKHVEIPELSNQAAASRTAEVKNRHSKAKEAAIRDPDRPEVLIEGVLFRARYLGSTQLISEGQPSKAMRMMQAQEAVGRIKAPEGENQPSTDVDLFVSTEKIMVLNTDLQEIMMDHSLRTISYIADIGDILVIMARRRLITSPDDVLGRRRRQAKILCHVFESDEAQLIAQSIGQAFQVAYLEFLKANGIEDPGLLKEMDYQDVLNQQEIYGEELNLFANKDFHKEVIVPKSKNEPLGVVIVESGWGSMVPTVVLANMLPSGPAARCGQLNIGDQIISINGISLVGLPLSSCQTYIKASRSQTVVKLTVVPCPPVVEVLIKRPDVKYQLGFSVQNGVICSLLRGGIAERGGVRVGHRIIEINNQSVVAVPHEKIVTLLASSVGEIHMKTMPTSIFRLLTGQDVPHYL